MASYLMPPNQYLNQCWLIIDGADWYSRETNFAGRAQDINSYIQFEKNCHDISQDDVTRFE